MKEEIRRAARNQPVDSQHPCKYLGVEMDGVMNELSEEDEESS